jgi:hypothetical protein
MNGLRKCGRIDSRWWLGYGSRKLSSVVPETSLRCQSYTWVILISFNQNNNHHYLMIFASLGAEKNSKTDP